MSNDYPGNIGDLWMFDSQSLVQWFDHWCYIDIYLGNNMLLSVLIDENDKQITSMIYDVNTRSQNQRKICGGHY